MPGDDIPKSVWLFGQPVPRMTLISGEKGENNYKLTEKS
jgi:hypothetical protein